MNLPAGYIQRPALLSDAEQVAELLNTCSREHTGEAEWDKHKLANDWSSPIFTIDKDACVVQTQNGELVGYVDIWDESPHVHLMCLAAVHPSHRSKGIGTALVKWADWRGNQSLTKAPDGAKVSQFQEIPSSNTKARDLLEKNGYSTTRLNFWLEIELDKAPPEPKWPEGVELKTFNEHADLRAVLCTTNEAFKDHWGYVEHDLEEDLKEWKHLIANDPKYDPSLWFLAVAGEEIVGTCLGKSEMPDDPNMGWLDALAVLKPWRKRGIATALLQHAFGEFYRRGKTRAGLGADAQNLTGAISLYKKIGMQVKHQFTILEKVLRPGKELVKRK